MTRSKTTTRLTERFRIAPQGGASYEVEAHTTFRQFQELSGAWTPPLADRTRLVTTTGLPVNAMDDGAFEVLMPSGPVRCQRLS